MLSLLSTILRGLLHWIVLCFRVDGFRLLRFRGSVFAAVLKF